MTSPPIFVFFVSLEQRNSCKCTAKITNSNQHEELKKKNAELEERLKKYTCGKNHKTYYEKNKQKVMENGANYLQKLKCWHRQI